jgi:hypothetical protein
MPWVSRALIAVAVGALGCRGDRDPTETPIGVAPRSPPPAPPITHAPVLVAPHVIASPHLAARVVHRAPMARRVVAMPPPAVAVVEDAPDELRAVDDLEPSLDLDQTIEPLELHARGSVQPRATSGRHHAYGVGFDIGVPDGAVGAFVVRPWPTIELATGVSYNGISYGGRVGATWIPLAGRVTPTLSLDVGHYTDGDANPLVRLVTGNPMFASPVLDRVGYDYADALVGLALVRRSWTAFVRVGGSRVTGTIHDLGSLASGKNLMFGSDPTVSLMTVSARLGVIIYFAK